MKKVFLKFVALACIICMSIVSFGCAEIEGLVSEIVSTVERITQLYNDLKSVTDNFSDFTPPIDGNGTITEDWTGTELCADFEKPVTLTSYSAGYFETNEYGTLHTNTGSFASIDDIENYALKLKDAGFEEYNLTFGWQAFNLLKNTGKTCIALKKGDVYIQLAFMQGNTPNSVFNIATYDIIDAVLKQKEEDSSTETSSPDNDENTSAPINEQTSEPTDEQTSEPTDENISD